MGNSILDVTGGWTQSKLIPSWFGAENQGGGIAVADINGDGKPEFIVSTSTIPPETTTATIA
jgi:hypothetical protein